MEASRPTPVSPPQVPSVQPRVVMLMGSDPFGHDWSRTASRVAEVVELRAVNQFEWKPIDGLPFLARSPERHCYEISTLRWRPGRVLGRWSDRLMARRYYLALLYIAGQHGHIDLLHTQFYSRARHLPFLKQQLGIQYVISEQSSALTGESPEKRVSAQGLRHMIRAYSDADCVMPVSSFLLGAIRRLEIPGKFCVVPNPVNLEHFPVASFELPDTVVKLIAVGRLSPVKGHDVLLRALAIARQNDSRLTLTIVGDGPLRGDLEALCKDLGLSDVVRFTGHRSRPDVSQWLRASHIFVLASKVETFGVAIVEAALTGLPLVVTGVGAIPENVSGANAVLPPPEDPTQFAGGILEAVRRLESHRPEKQAAWFRSRFSDDAVAGMLADIYGAAAYRNRLGSHLIRRLDS
jgi:glycosyltransferase involved in cell wall biosynthesis